MASKDIFDTTTVLQAIHECVNDSTIRHVLNLPHNYLLAYLSKYPFYRGADTLYYFLLKRLGPAAYYAVNGVHLTIVNPELLGVYILAEQDINAPIQKGSSDTIYLTIIKYIERTIYCPQYQLRNEIIIGEAPFSDAKIIPSIALNTPYYQRQYSDLSDVPAIRAELILYDCLEPITTMDDNLFLKIFKRIAYVKALMPNLWKVILEDYYRVQLIRLRIYNILPILSTRILTQLHTVYPEIVQLPHNINALGIRLWLSSRSSRAYLLGMDVRDGLPSDEAVSRHLQLLNEVGIEKYVSTITKINFHENGLLTGQIGLLTYPELAGKRLVNQKDLTEKMINTYYPIDIFPIVLGDDVVIITYQDVGKLSSYTDVTLEQLRRLIRPQNIPYLREELSHDTFIELCEWAFMGIDVQRGIPARNRLVEIMAYDDVDY